MRYKAVLVDPLQKPQPEKAIVTFSQHLTDIDEWAKANFAKHSHQAYVVVYETVTRELMKISTTVEPPKKEDTKDEAATGKK